MNKQEIIDLLDLCLNDEERGIKKQWSETNRDAIEAWVDENYEVEHLSEQQAKEVLKDKGYFVGNLWHIDDVRERTKENLKRSTCFYILEDCLLNDNIMGQINDLIDDHVNN